MFCGPAFHDNFLFGIELDSVASLCVLHAEEAIFPATEREIGHGRSDSDVDADVPRWCFVSEPARRRAVGREQRRLISICAALKKCQRAVEVTSVNTAKDGAKDCCVGG